MKSRTPVIERLLARCERMPNGCLVFRGTVNRGGYGVINVGGHDGPMRLAHRVMYEAEYGPIPEGEVIDHVWPRCQYKTCVEPTHLEAVTVAENNRRMHAAGRGNRDTSAAIAVRVANQRAKTQCPRGHSYDAENTYVDRWGKRSCKECTRRAVRSRRA